ncbi:MAG TPA: substrate-binding domain-containing protein [Rhodopila sp.]|nr:substrate-binding domain-containing protein [Rhodopila sp.]
MKTILGAVLSVLLTIAGAQAAELHVATSGGFSAALKNLAPVYEKQTGDRLVLVFGPSMGTTPNTVPNRLARGEKLDAVVIVGYALDGLIKQGKVRPDSKVDLAKSGIAVAVRHGAPHPDISTVAALKQTLLDAKSIAYSDSASGVYISTEMFRKMGIADALAGKSHMIPATPVGEIVAKGEAEIGFQQASELKPIQGIDIVGPVPEALQKYTVFAGGVVASSAHQADAARLLRFLSGPEARQAVIDSGMTPIP